MDQYMHGLLNYGVLGIMCLVLLIWVRELYYRVVKHSDRLVAIIESNTRVTQQHTDAIKRLADVIERKME